MTPTEGPGWTRLRVFQRENPLWCGLVLPRRGNAPSGVEKNEAVASASVDWLNGGLPPTRRDAGEGRGGPRQRTRQGDGWGGATTIRSFDRGGSGAADVRQLSMRRPGPMPDKLDERGRELGGVSFVRNDALAATGAHLAMRDRSSTVRTRIGRGRFPPRSVEYWIPRVPRPRLRALHRQGAKYRTTFASYRAILILAASSRSTLRVCLNVWWCACVCVCVWCVCIRLFCRSRFPLLAPFALRWAHPEPE